MTPKRKVQSEKRKVKTQSLKFLVLSFSFALFVLSFSLLAFAQPISSTELINNAKEYDDKTVVYAGEVIGEIMGRGQYAWINVHDGQNAIGIWIAKDFIKNILYTGNYKSKGDWVEVTGIFRRSCLEHGGDLDIHCQGLRTISQGKQNIFKLNPSKRNQIIILLAILIMVWILRPLKIR